MAKKVLCVLTLMFLAIPAWTRGWEYYVEYKTKVPIEKKQKILFDFKEETRYKDGGNYYRKSFFGISKRITSELEGSLYYAFKEKRKNRWKKLHMFWLQGDKKVHFNKFMLASSTKLERHCYADTYKFREKLEAVFPLNTKIRFFIGDEARIFSLFDSPYFGENEALCGFYLMVFKEFALKVYYDLRRIKSEGAWQTTNCLRTVFNLKF